MNDLVEEIAEAGKEEIGELPEAVPDRYAVLYPDWNVSTISLQKSGNRDEQLDRMIAMLQNLKVSP
ncbi:MAG: hypothetical protein PUB93_07765 [Firmicutes bacterium]|nr:hypothetical protein [Bacillota bacterium]